MPFSLIPDLILPALTDLTPQLLRARGIGLLISWGVTNLVRSCAQAKLLGDQIGLDPLASLTAIYIGWRVKGVIGMLLFPLILVTLCQLNDRGVIRLWKEP